MHAWQDRIETVTITAVGPCMNPQAFNRSCGAARSRVNESQTKMAATTTHRWRIGLRAAAVAVACIALLAWSARSIWESQTEARVSARSLRSADKAERVSAARHLAELTAERDVAIALSSLTGALEDRDPDVRATAAQSLHTLIVTANGRKLEPELVISARSSLLQALNDDAPLVRFSAATTLARVVVIEKASGVADSDRKTPTPINPQLLVESVAEVLAMGDPLTTSGALSTLRSLGRDVDAAPPRALIAALKDRSGVVRAQAARALRAFRVGIDPVIPLVFDLLEHDGPQVRAELAFGFRDTPPSPAVVPLLIDALASPSPDVRRAAFGMLGSIGPKAGAAVPVLIGILENADSSHADPNAVAQATEALGKIGPSPETDAQAVSALDRILKSDRSSLHGAAAGAIATFGARATSSVPALIAALERAATERTRGLDGSGGNGSRPTQSASALHICAALGRTAPGTIYAQEAIEALERAARREMATGTAPDSRILLSVVIYALGRFGPSAVPALKNLRESAPPFSRSEIDRVLKNVSNAR